MMNNIASLNKKYYQCFLSQISVSPKLTKKYLCYRRVQVLFSIGTYEIENHLTGFMSLPSLFVMVKDDLGTSLVKTNPNFSNWKKYDRLLMSQLFVLISESLFGYISKCTTALEIWGTLQNYCVLESKVRVMELKLTLQTLKKGNLTIHDYVRQMKEVYDSLVLSGQIIIEGELINFIVDGIGSENDAIVAHFFFQVGFN